MSSGRTWPLHDIAIANIVWCLAYESGVGDGTIHCAILCVTKIQEGEVKEAFQANNRIDWCTMHNQSQNKETNIFVSCKGRKGQGHTRRRAALWLFARASGAGC